MSPRLSGPKGAQVVDTTSTVRSFAIRHAEAVFLFKGRIPRRCRGKPGEKTKTMSLKIMVVDDETRTPNLIRSVATVMGHSVRAFEDRHAAGEQGAAERFDVVFVGMRLAELDGLELPSHIRRSQANGEATIVMLSATEDVASSRRAFGEGADLILTKPVSGECLRRLLSAINVPGWRSRKSPARLPLFTDVTCTWKDGQIRLRSVNISETGMLLQGSLEAEIGDEVTLEFRLADVGASLKARARISRKEGRERFGVEFVGLAGEDKNAIQVYVMGRKKEAERPPDLSVEGAGPRRLFRP
jgi:CheY-like chemotaxis protein